MTAEQPTWPLLRTYDAAHSLKVALPLGGIGTGTVSLGGRGDLRDWEIVNRPAKAFAPRSSFFAVRTAPAGTAIDPTDATAESGESASARGVVARALEGRIDLVLFEGAHGSGVSNHGLPRFRHSSAATTYPFVEVTLSDPEMPLDVRLQAFNPFVPLDADVSGIPVAVLRYVVRNDAAEPMDVSLVGTLQNFVGVDGSGGESVGNRNVVRRGAGLVGVFGDSTGVDPNSERAGSLALSVLGEDEVSTRTKWMSANWSGALLDLWDDFVADGHVDERAGGPGEDDAPMMAVAAKRMLAPGEEHAFTYLLTWHFPNRLSWDGETTVGNYYATTYADAWDVAARLAPRLPELESETLAFVKELAASDVPEVIREGALANLSTLRTQTSYRSADGWFWGWEGCNDDSGCCLGNCTHVWNYEHATPYLFGDLAKALREIEFVHGTDETGHMAFRVQQPLDRAHSEGVAAADGQMGALVKLYREWRLSGDDDLLRRLWPKARKALEFAWIEGGWDADVDGVMEGSQHNTMDIEFFGPNPQIAGWYLAALRACAEMARHVGEAEFAEKCEDLFGRGRTWIDAHLWNGEYYRQKVRPPGSEEAIAPGLRLPGIGARNLTEPELQLGEGCQVDQLVGQVLAHTSGLGYLLDPEHVRDTYAAILKHNRPYGVGAHFNPMRSYALNEEEGLLVAAYPRGGRPARPFPYFGEVWPGLEHNAAVGMIYEGMCNEAVGVVETTRGRYDGRTRNPFDEAECGHHYVRSMASWGEILAWTGFGYDAVTGELRFAGVSEPTRWFWSTGHAWGRVTLTPDENGTQVEVAVKGGTLRLAELILTGERGAVLGRATQSATLVNGERCEVHVPRVA